LARAAPMPVDAPVTSTALPARSGMESCVMLASAW
jgi:hypothetical protein